MEEFACPENPECKYYPTCYADTHHFYWPKRKYKGGVERQFRELPENKAEICREFHDNIYATEAPPLKPTRSEMLQVISEAVIKHGA